MTREPPVARLLSLRAQINDIEEQLATIENRPRHVDEAKALLGNTLSQAAERSDVRHRVAQPWLAAGCGGFGSGDALTLGDLAFLLGPDALSSLIVDRMAARFPDGIKTADREKRAAALRKQRRSVEIDEEREIMRLEDTGTFPGRRSSADLDLMIAVWSGKGAA